MAYKNWDNVRDHRIYVYMNQAEMDAFLEAMRIRDMEQPATAARRMIIERSQQIIAERKSKQSKGIVTTVTYQLSNGKNTVWH